MVVILPILTNIVFIWFVTNNKFEASSSKKQKSCIICGGDKPNMLQFDDVAFSDRLTAYT